MTATGRAGPFGKLLRVREAEIVELADSRTLRPAGRSNDELTNGRSKSMASHKN